MHPVEQALKILGLASNASQQDVKRAYRHLAKVWHPDRFPIDSPDRRLGEEKFKAVNDAYKFLRDYNPASIARLRSQGRPPAGPHPTPQRPPQRWQGPKAGPSQAARRRPLPRWARLLAAGVAILLAGYLISPSKTGRAPEPQAVPRKASPPPALAPKKPITASPTDHPESRPVTPSLVDASTPLPAGPPAGEGDPSFTVGSTKEEVTAVQGTPSRSSEEVWKYGVSLVFFTGGRVTHWEIKASSPLKARLFPSRPPGVATDHFTNGSSKDEVIAVQGTPTEFSDSVWKYGLSSIYFSGGRVTSWDEEIGSPLKTRAPKGLLK